MFTSQSLKAADGIRHSFFTRQGGTSDGIYASLNCGYGSKDDPERVAENRARAAEHLGLSSDRMLTVYQTHSRKAVAVSEPWAPSEAPKADAMVTRQPGLGLGILTADCGPVLFADPQAQVIGAAHAGWRGALDGILEATIEAMEGLGAARQHILAGLGPCIAQPSYEVGPEFPQPFLDANAADADLFAPSPRHGHFLFDLKGFVARRLERGGITSIDVLAHDTCADEDRFFSYRRCCQRGETDYGRGLSLISLEP